jgi:hypothetical protein
MRKRVKDEKDGCGDEKEGLKMYKTGAVMRKRV